MMMKKHTITFVAVLMLFCARVSHAEPEARRAWIPPVSAVHAPLTKNPALWPTASTNAVLPVSIGVNPRGGTVGMIHVEYLTKDITFEEVCDSVDAKFKEFKSKRKDQRAAIWIVPTESVIITVIELKDHVTLDIKPNKVPDWLSPLDKKK